MIAIISKFLKSNIITSLFGVITENTINKSQDKIYEKFLEPQKIKKTIQKADRYIKRKYKKGCTIPF